MLILYCIMTLDGEPDEGFCGTSEATHKAAHFATYCESVWFVPGTYEEELE